MRSLLRFPPTVLLIAMSFTVPASAQRTVNTDVTWHNGSTGETQIWYMTGHTRRDRANILGEDGSPILVGAPWRIVGTSDMNADSNPDIVWHNGSTGHTQIWQMNGPRITARLTVLGENGSEARVGAPWRVAAIGDFTGDGKPDLVWHNRTSGETQVWHMNGFRVGGRTSVVGETGSVALVGTPWSIVTANDMNADGKSDIIWHNSTTGETQVWHMNGQKVSGRANVVGEAGTDARAGSPWRIAGSRDFNRDGKADLLWHNGSSGETQIWHMNGSRVIGRATVVDEGGRVANVGLPWRIVGGVPETAAPPAATADNMGSVPAAPPPAAPVIADIKDVFISQVYGGGGSAGPPAAIEYDFVEIFNRGDAPVDVTGWAVQYASAAGTVWQVTPLNGLIQPNGYYLVRQGEGAVNMMAPDATGTISMAAGAGKVVITQTTRALTVACPGGAVVVDRIGYGANGSGPGCGDEWGGRTNNLGKDTAAHRNDDGCVNTGSAADFSLLPPNPRNSSSTFKSCAR